MYTYYVCIEQENNLQSKLCANAFLVISISMSSGYIKNKAKISKKKSQKSREHSSKFPSAAEHTCSSFC